jgi:hypothetical protein
MFVRHNPEDKKRGEEFELPDSGWLVLHKHISDIIHVFTCQVVALGDRTNAGYTARSVVWMLVRGLGAVSS